jgi:hypothetical protein
VDDASSQLDEALERLGEVQPPVVPAVTCPSPHQPTTMSAYFDATEPPLSPDSEASLSFEGQIRPLFRERDRQLMRSYFDLWSYDDVCNHAAAIVARLRA